MNDRVFERLLTRQEVAEILNVSSRTVRRLEERRLISRVRLSGSTVRYKRKEVEDFIERRTIERRTVRSW